MQITYRKLRSGDESDYRRVRLEGLKKFPENFGTSYEDESKLSKLKFEEFIVNESADNFIFGAFADDRLIGIVGFIRAARTKARHCGEVVSMYVTADFHGRKVGENILRELVKAAFELAGIESIELKVIGNNSAAIKLYEKIGFETFGIRKNGFKANDRYWDQQFMQLTRERYLSEGYKENKWSFFLDWARLPVW
jgi:RimJ/RimL family protein N-acetyltransferase